MNLDDDRCACGHVRRYHAEPPGACIYTSGTGICGCRSFMMSAGEPIDPEIAALQSTLTALSPLTREQRLRAMCMVSLTLGLYGSAELFAGRLRSEYGEVSKTLKVPRE